MKKLKFKPLQIHAGVEYNGQIERIEVNEDKGTLRIYVQIQDFPCESFMKSMRLSLNSEGQLARFFEELGVMTNRREVDLEELEGEFVIVTMNQGRDGNFYVNEMWLADVEIEDTETYYEEEE